MNMSSLFRMPQDLPVDVDTLHVVETCADGGDAWGATMAASVFVCGRWDHIASAFARSQDALDAVAALANRNWPYRVAEYRRVGPALEEVYKHARAFVAAAQSGECSADTEDDIAERLVQACDLLLAPASDATAVADAANADELRQLEREFSYLNATGVIEKHCSVFDSYFGPSWFDLRSAGVDVTDEVKYLHSRGLLEVHPDKPHWVSIRDESEPLPVVKPSPSVFQNEMAGGESAWVSKCVTFGGRHALDARLKKCVNCGQSPLNLPLDPADVIDMEAAPYCGACAHLLPSHEAGCFYGLAEGRPR